ncbi:MAG: methylated-DNA--[protein]-cysteine S-methyltransferase [Chloroflexi bacterium]|nr:MAG: methylated-DNA--[protein]-cysteine S-methyltransferase [Chloroflexota bacterium]
MRGTIFRTDWGWVGLAATERGVRAVVLPKATKRAVERELRRVANGNSTPTFVLPPQGGGKYLRAAHEAIIAYLQGRARTFDLPLDLDGQPSFRVKVWKVLQRIPYGRVRSYGWVARKVGKPQAARAIGGACGANPVPLLVPCHRVVAGDGSLGGFSGGVGVKKRLLRLEGLTPK